MFHKRCLYKRMVPVFVSFLNLDRNDFDQFIVGGLSRRLLAECLASWHEI